MPVKKARTAAHAPKKVTRPASVRPKPASAPRVAAKPAATVAKGASSAAAPSAIGATHHHLDYTSHDLAGIKRFYTQLLGFTHVIEEPQFGYLTIQTTPTTSIGFMAPVPGPPEQWRPPGEPVLFFFVKDVDRAHKDLLAKGVSFQQPPTDMPWGMRVATCRDPEGRTVCMAQRS